MLESLQHLIKLHALLHLLANRRGRFLHLKILNCRKKFPASYFFFLSTPLSSGCLALRGNHQVGAKAFKSLDNAFSLSLLVKSSFGRILSGHRRLALLTVLTVLEGKAGVLRVGRLTDRLREIGRAGDLRTWCGGDLAGHLLLHSVLEEQLAALLLLLVVGAVRIEIGLVRAVNGVEPQRSLRLLELSVEQLLVDGSHARVVWLTDYLLHANCLPFLSLGRYPFVALKGVGCQNHLIK